MYTKILAEALAGDGADVVVVTERFPGAISRESRPVGHGSVTVHRLFPLRAGRAVVDWRSYLAYAWQNCLMLALPSRLAYALRRKGADKAVVLVHASLFSKRSLMPLILKRIRRRLPDAASLVVDVRDPLFGPAQVPNFTRFDAAIASSRMNADRLRALLPTKVDVVHIPIPFEPPKPPTNDDVAAVLAEHGLTGIPYVLNPNGINEAKRYAEMLDVVRELRRLPGYEEMILVTIGYARDWKTRDDCAVAEGVLKYIGVVSNGTSLALMKGAKATLVISLIESPSRSALESIALGTPLIAPPVAEFVNTIPAAVAHPGGPRDIAHQIVRVIEDPALERYPMKIHSPTSILEAYRTLEPEHTATMRKMLG